jgi:stress-induced morphogen
MLGHHYGNAAHHSGCQASIAKCEKIVAMHNIRPGSSQVMPHPRQSRQETTFRADQRNLNSATPKRLTKMADSPQTGHRRGFGPACDHQVMDKAFQSSDFKRIHNMNNARLGEQINSSFHSLGLRSSCPTKLG